MVNGMSWASFIPITDELRERFAAEYLRNGGDVWEAGKACSPSDPSKGIALGAELIADDQVQARIKELRDTKGERAFLATKEDVAREIYKLATGRANQQLEPKEKLAAFRLYSEVMGYIEKPQGGVSVTQNNLVQKVMVVKDFGTDAQWESAAVEQQRRLISEAAEDA